MGQRTWDQATGLLKLIKQTGWDSDTVQVLFKNWGLYREITEALREGRVEPDRLRLLLEGKDTGRVLDVRPCIEMMIHAGCHRVTNGGQGMPASRYRKLWPETVIQPPEYVGRFDTVLAVDYTIGAVGLKKCGYVEFFILPSDCTNSVERPSFDHETNERLCRYIAFVQLGKKNLRFSAKDCYHTFASDEVGLVTTEGLHLPIQHGSYLLNYGVALVGSHYRDLYVPGVRRFDHNLPEFDAMPFTEPIRLCGSASRGIMVIPVT